MDLKHFLVKALSILLILSGIYQIFLSLKAIFFVYPYYANNYGYRPFWVEEGLVEKALILYLTMVVNGMYGITLLFKPAREVRIAHIFVGILIFLGSVFFISRNPITTDPVQQFLLKLLGG